MRQLELPSHYTPTTYYAVFCSFRSLTDYESFQMLEASIGLLINMHLVIVLVSTSVILDRLTHGVY